MCDVFPSAGSDFVYNGVVATTRSRVGEFPMPDLPIPANIRNLPVPDRIELATKIWESVAEDNAAVGLSDEHKRIIDDRIREADENPDSMISSEEVFRDLLGDQ